MTKNLLKITAVEESYKKECTVTKTFANSLAKSKKKVTSFQRYNLQNYSLKDPKWKGLLPTPKSVKSS